MKAVIRLEAVKGKNATAPAECAKG
jgi:hypothetical protein